MAEKKFSTGLAQIIAEAFALAQRNVWKATSLEDLTDEALVELLEEGEMLVTMTPLEHELNVRLGARLELDSRT